VRRRPICRPSTDNADPPPSAAALRTIAIRLLGRRDYTAAELRDRLIARGAGEEDAAAIVERLSADGLVDDRRAAAAHIRTATRVRLRGRRRVARELEARGVDPALTADILRDETPEGELGAIRAILARRRFPASPTIDERRRMFQHLLRRGFDAESIRRVLRGDGE
jgi:regulatory protein